MLYVGGGGTQVDYLEFVSQVPADQVTWGRIKQLYD
jgi:hypothetical protein